MQDNELDTIEDVEEINEDNVLSDDLNEEEKTDLNASENNEDEKSREEKVETDDVGSIDASKQDDKPQEPVYQPMPNEIGIVQNVGVDSVTIKVTSSLAFEKNLLDHHVIFVTNTNQRIVGTLISLNQDSGQITLIGEIQGVRFVPGVLTKPSIGNRCFAATDEETKMIVVDDQNNVLKKVLIGTMPLYNNTPAYVPTNTFFSNHFAIFGNTGSGKSCGVARIFQNIFFNTNQAPRNACVFIFDAYGEYESALSIPNSSVQFKRYSTNVRTNPNSLIKLPLWLLDVDDFALLLEAEDPTQLPIIEKALRLVTVFSGNEEETKVYKNDIIAKAILEVLYSGGSASQIHDQIFAILTSFNTPDLNLETPIAQPGYIRSLRQCLIIDKEGKIGEMQLVTEFIKKFINDDLKLELPDGTIPFTLENLREAFEFALISEGILKSDKLYDKANVLKVRLDSLIKGEYAEYFKVDKYIDKQTFIKELITAPNGARAQIININISYLDDRLAKTICKIYAKLLFELVRH